MTIRDLIEELSKYPDNTRVSINGDPTCIDVRYIPNYPIGNPSDPNCERIDVVDIW